MHNRKRKTEIMTTDELRQRVTVNVPTAAGVLGISRTHAYEGGENRNHPGHPHRQTNGCASASTSEAGRYCVCRRSGPPRLVGDVSTAYHQSPVAAHGQKNARRE